MPQKPQFFLIQFKKNIFIKYRVKMKTEVFNCQTKNPIKMKNKLGWITYEVELVNITAYNNFSQKQHKDLVIQIFCVTCSTSKVFMDRKMLDME